MLTTVLMTMAFLTSSGCSERVEQFEPNLVYLRNQDIATELEDFQTKPVQNRVKDVQRVMAHFFGTPDQPRLPEIEGLDYQGLLELEMLQVAAGSAQDSLPGDERGLFRSMCARCHGVTGNGAGPEARQLNPYPRDYRRGIFKFKRTPLTVPPTDADLHNVLVRGVPGTAMPAFRLLSEVEREALVQYVRYLSVRGMFERAIIEEAAFELDDDEWFLDPELSETSRARRMWMEFLEEIAVDVIQQWLDAENQRLTVPPPPADYGSRQSIARGRELFFTTLTNCATCHGATALGDGQTDDYDEWSKELAPDSPLVLKDYLALGALPPRNSQPRNLNDGIYRGGHDAESLFVKVTNGISGTTMPPVAAQLSDDDIWHLVAFARYLPFDPIHRPARPAETPESEDTELEDTELEDTELEDTATDELGG